MSKFETLTHAQAEALANSSVRLPQYVQAVVDGSCSPSVLRQFTGEQIDAVMLDMVSKLTDAGYITAPNPIVDPGNGSGNAPDVPVFPTFNPLSGVSISWGGVRRGAPARMILTDAAGVQAPAGYTLPDNMSASWQYGAAPYWQNVPTPPEGGVQWDVPVYFQSTHSIRVTLKVFDLVSSDTIQTVTSTVKPKQAVFVPLSPTTYSAEITSGNTTVGSTVDVSIYHAELGQVLPYIGFPNAYVSFQWQRGDVSEFVGWTDIEGQTNWSMRTPEGVTGWIRLRIRVLDEYMQAVYYFSTQVQVM